jgi:dolichol kinase
METILVTKSDYSVRGLRNLSEEIRIELLRKGIHLLIAFVPGIAAFSLQLAVLLLTSGIVFYTVTESLRRSGVSVPLVSRVTALAARKRDAGKFVLGPITLGCGALCALLFYPDPAASIAIYALAFGDGLSSLVGKSFGSIKLPFTGGKSLEGSLTCFFAVYFSTFALTSDSPRSLVLALAATLVEAAPLKDLDNILLPMITGAAAILLFRL